MKFEAKLLLICTAFMFSCTLGVAQERPIAINVNGAVSWLFVRNDGYIWWGNLSDEEAILLRKDVQGSFLWYEEKGNGHLIKDPRILSRLDQLSHDQEALHNADANRPKAPKRGDSYTSSESVSANARGFMEVLQTLCRQAIKDGLTVARSRPISPGNQAGPVGFLR